MALTGAGLFFSIEQPGLKKTADNNAATNATTITPRPRAYDFGFLIVTAISKIPNLWESLTRRKGSA